MRINSFFIGFICLLFISCDNSNYIQGKALYQSNCATCHMPDGTGVAKLYPALTDFDTSRISIYDMPCLIRYGQDSEDYTLKMEGLKNLKDIEINNIINYILNDMNSIDHEFQIDDTRRILQNCQDR